MPIWPPYHCHLLGDETRTLRLANPVFGPGSFSPPPLSLFLSSLLLSSPLFPLSSQPGPGPQHTHKAMILSHSYTL